VSRGVIISGVRTSIESPRKGRTDYELWTSSTSLEMWDFALNDWTRHFDCHSVEPAFGYLGIKLGRGQNWRYYTKVGPERIIYLWEKHPEVPASRPYPLDAVETALPQVRGRLGDTLDMQIALAIAEGHQEIILNGCGFIDPAHKGTKSDATTNEWLAYHRSSLYWIGYCEGRGIKLTFEGRSVFGPLANVYGLNGAVKEAAQVVA
jgi:hypothetical protein